MDAFPARSLSNCAGIGESKGVSYKPQVSSATPALQGRAAGAGRWQVQEHPGTWRRAYAHTSALHHEPRVTSVKISPCAERGDAADGTARNGSGI